MGSFSPSQDTLFDTDAGTFKIGATPFSGGRTVTVFSSVTPVDVVVFDFTTIDVPPGVAVTAIGSGPLILLAQSTANVDGVIDVSGEQGDEGGPLAGGGAGANGMPGGGGIAEAIAEGPASAADAPASGSSRDYAAPIAAAAGVAGLLAVAAGGWYVRRRLS